MTEECIWWPIQWIYWNVYNLWLFYFPPLLTISHIVTFLVFVRFWQSLYPLIAVQPTPYSFVVSICMEYRFPSPHFKAMCVFGLQWLSCREHVVGPFFFNPFIHSKLSNVSFQFVIYHYSHIVRKLKFLACEKEHQNPTHQRWSQDGSISSSVEISSTKHM